MSRPTTVPEESASSITIREFYNGFVAPRYVVGLVAQMVSSVAAKHTSGLEAIVLTNQSGRRVVPMDAC